MSHSYGKVYEKEGKLIGYFEYNGTCDVALSAIQKTAEDVNKYWRSNQNCRECLCKSPIEKDVILWTDYGDGFYWNAKICENCMAILNNRMPFEVESMSSQNWFDFSKEETVGCGLTDGHPFLN